jgi:ATP-binding cassette subfamily G (WHITE) protein 2 (SNQ2)
MIAFFTGFLAAYLIITEFKSKFAETRSVVAFKRGTTQTQTPAPKPGDIEAGDTTAGNPVDDLRGDDAKAETALATAEKMTDTFSWEGLNYTVPVRGGAERKLLNDVSGYVVPGRLTALMGESGAGKVRPSLFINHTKPH